MPAARVALRATDGGARNTALVPAILAVICRWRLRRHPRRLGRLRYGSYGRRQGVSATAVPPARPSPLASFFPPDASSCGATSSPHKPRKTKTC